MRIESDSAAIEKNLRLIEKMYMDHDGWVDPDMVIKCEGGAMSVEKHAPMGKKPLIAMPSKFLLPTDKMGLHVKGDEILMAPEKDALSDEQRRLAEAMIEIYNLTNKIAIHKASYIWMIYFSAPQYLEMILEGRSRNERQKGMLEKLHKGVQKGKEYDEMVCDTYIHTRTLGHKEYDAEADKQVMVANIMPLVDFINHDHRGAAFNFDKKYLSKKEEGPEFLLVADSRPVLTSNECFAFYSQMDAFDSFISYGFPDAESPLVRSVPMELEIPGAGKLVFKAFASGWKKGKLHKNIAGLRPFIPMTVKKEEGLLELSHLLIPCSTLAPHALRRVLRLMITNLAMRALKSEQIWEQVLQAEEKILQTNINFYKDLLAKLEADEGSGDPATMPGLCKHNVEVLARMQLSKLYKYQYADQENEPEKDAAGDEHAAVAAA